MPPRRCCCCERRTCEMFYVGRVAERKSERAPALGTNATSRVRGAFMARGFPVCPHVAALLKGARWGGGQRNKAFKRQN